MEMYTELIFGGSLKKETPKQVIKDLKTMIKGNLETVSKEVKGFRHIFRVSSYCFGVNEPLAKIWKDRIDGQWKISTRSNIKNYNGEIETFLEWIRPWIEQGTGFKDMYAIVCYEEQDVPDLYYLTVN